MEKNQRPTARGGTHCPPSPVSCCCPQALHPARQTCPERQVLLQGPAIDHERYYRITFTESPATQVDEGSRRSTGNRRGEAGPAVHLVVRPRQSFCIPAGPGTERHHQYRQHLAEFMVKQGCQQADSEADSNTCCPGERPTTIPDQSAGQPETHRLPVPLHPGGRRCWPD